MVFPYSFEIWVYIAVIFLERLESADGRGNEFLFSLISKVIEELALH